MLRRGADLSLLDEVIEALSQGKALDERYKDHILIGNYLGLHECHIEPDWLLIYMIEDDILTLTLINTGTHSDLFD